MLLDGDVDGTHFDNKLSAQGLAKITEIVASSSSGLQPTITTTPTTITDPASGGPVISNVYPASPSIKGMLPLQREGDPFPRMSIIDNDRDTTNVMFTNGSTDAWNGGSNVSLTVSHVDGGNPAGSLSANYDGDGSNSGYFTAGGQAIISSGDGGSNTSYIFINPTTIEIITGTLTISNGNISSPGSGTASEQFGLGATAAGNNVTLVGAGGLIDVNSSNTVGLGAVFTSAADNSALVGYAAQSYSSSTVVVGASTIIGTNSDNGTLVGKSASISGSSPNALVAGKSATVTGANGIALGAFSSAAANAIAIGKSVTASTADEIVIGLVKITPGTPSDGQALIYSTSSGHYTPTSISSSTSIVDKTANYSLTNSDDVVNFTTSATTLTFHNVTTATKKLYTIKNSSSGNISFATTSSQTVDGSTTGTIIPNQSLTVCPNGALTAWIIV